jgi:hypothetical protein
VSAALITITSLSVAGLVTALVVGFTASTPAELLGHATFAVFVTLLVLLSHSLTMFYLIGKGKAIREAATDGGLSGEFFASVSRARKPVFSHGSLAMALTMATAILGGGVDTRVLPPLVHSSLAIGAAISNLWTLQLEVRALTATSRITSEVNRLLRAA